ncbi:MAG: glycosyltransferase family 10 domain-containing protein, partial [Planctomyces sp.]
RRAHAARVGAGPGLCGCGVANRSARARRALFGLLSAHRRVDAAGPVGRNVPPLAPGTLAKRAFLRGYRFALVYENRAWPGYCTEKLAEALAAGCIPIYWGDPHAARDFNPACFLRREDFASDQALAQRVIELDTDEAAFMAMAAQPCFVDDRVPESLSDETARRFIQRVLVHAGVPGA